MRDEDPFGLFVRLHSEALFRFAYLLTGSSMYAEELLQDTLTRLYPRWARVAAADSPVAYVRRSLANRYVSVHRRPLIRQPVRQCLRRIHSRWW